MKNLLEKLEKVSDYASLQDFENSCDNDTLLSVCYEIEKHNFEDKEDLREYIIATLGGDDEDTYRLDLECFFEGLAFEHFKSEEEYDKIKNSTYCARIAGSPSRHWQKISD